MIFQNSIKKTIMEFIFSLINAISLFAMGFVVIKFRREIKKWTGTMTSIERHLGR
jgi:hypothetical protein